MKSNVDKSDVDKLVPVLVDLSKLSVLVKIDVIKKNVYNAKIKNIEDKIPDITNLATNSSLNAKVNEVKGEIPNITNLATAAALTTNKNKISNIRNLVKKLTATQKSMKLKKKITVHDHDKYIATPEFNKITAEYFAARLKQGNLASKSDITNFANK